MNRMPTPIVQAFIKIICTSEYSPDPPTFFVQCCAVFWHVWPPAQQFAPFFSTFSYGIEHNPELSPFAKEKICL